MVEVCGAEFNDSRLTILQLKLIESAQHLVVEATKVTRSETCQMFLARMEKEDAMTLGSMVNELLARLDALHASAENLVRAACL